MRAHDAGNLPFYNDTCCGQEFLDLFAAGKIRLGDILLQLSIDGAQLFRDKQSDCWIYIFIIHNLSPSLHYKKCFVIPGGFVGGPHHPQNIESFIFPGLYHIAALQNEGLAYFDAHRNLLVKDSRVLLPLGTADGVTMASIAGTVGHNGKFGCRLLCTLQGRHHPGDGHYYPAMQKPVDYDLWYQS